MKRVIVVGDIHAQIDKFWSILSDADLLSEGCKPSPALIAGDVGLILLGDLVHPKTRESYAALIGESRFDEYDPEQMQRVEQAEETFLHAVKTFSDAAQGHVTVLLGNHDHNALTGEEGVLRTDDLPHLEWHPSGRTLPRDLAGWLASWPYEYVIDGVHFAHVGPKPEHNRYDAGFYLENRRNWILEERDLVSESSYRFGVYGHTPVRGGAHFASQSRALLLDTNGVAGEYSYAELTITLERVRLKLRGVYLETWV